MVSSKTSAPGMANNMARLHLLNTPEIACEIDAGRGFTISRLGIVVNGLLGIYLLKDPPPKSHAAALTLLGCVCPTVGGILMGGRK